MPTIIYNMSSGVEFSIYGILQVLRKFQSLGSRLGMIDLNLTVLTCGIGFGEVLSLERWAKDTEAVEFQVGPPVW